MVSFVVNSAVVTSLHEGRPARKVVMTEYRLQSVEGVLDNENTARTAETDILKNSAVCLR